MLTISKSRPLAMQAPRAPLKRRALLAASLPQARPTRQLRDAWQAPLAGQQPDLRAWGPSQNNVLPLPRGQFVKLPVHANHDALARSAEIKQLAKQRQNPLQASTAAQRLKNILNRLNGPHFVREVDCELSIAAFDALLQVPDFDTFKYASDFAQRAQDLRNSTAKADKLSFAAQRDYEAYICARCKAAFRPQLQRETFYVQVKAYVEYLMTVELNTITDKMAATRALARLLDTEVQLRLLADLVKSQQVPWLTRCFMTYRLLKVLQTCWNGSALRI